MSAEESGIWRRRFWTVGKIVLVLALIGAAGYWFNFAPVAVEQHSVASGEVVVEVLGTGTLDAHIKATVSTKIPGRLVKVDVDQGDQVTVEQIVGRLDDHDLKHEVEIEVANVTARKAGVERLQADIVHAKATLELTTANEARQRRLRAANTVSQEEYDRVVEALAVAQASQSHAEAALAEGQATGGGREGPGVPAGPVGGRRHQGPVRGDRDPAGSQCRRCGRSRQFHSGDGCDQGTVGRCLGGRDADGPVASGAAGPGYVPL